jgi:hypothetical protein
MPKKLVRFDWASEKMDEMKLNEKERKSYNIFLSQLRDIASRNHTIEADAMDLIEKAKNKMIIGFYENEVPIAIIAKSTEMTVENVKKIIENYKK